MTDERKTRVYIEPPLHGANIPEETLQHIAKVGPMYDFISSVIEPNVDAESGQLRGGFDWASEIESFNKGSGGPEISLDEVANSLDRTRWPEEKAEQNKHLAGQIKDWLQSNQ